MIIEDTYTCSVAGQAVTLTPKTSTEAKPPVLAASTVVFNTSSSVTAVIASFWDNNYEYDVVIRRRTKTN